MTDAPAGPVPLDASGKAAGAVFVVLTLSGPVYFDVISDQACLQALLADGRE